MTLDALHCQVDTIKQIKEKGAVALIQCKKNQPNLHAAVDEHFQVYWNKPQEEQVSLIQTEKWHGVPEAINIDIVSYSESN